jgi:hypothetical protein
VTDRIGAALIKIIGSAALKEGEPNPASLDDAMALVDTILTSEDFRARCGAMASLSSEIAIAARKQTCRALLILMVTRREPLALPDVPKEQYLNTTQEYASLAAPLPGGAWSAHVEANYKPSGAAEYVRVSPYLGERVRAFEALFGVGGSLLFR